MQIYTKLFFDFFQKQKYLSELGTEYQTLISERAKKQITERIDNPIKKVNGKSFNRKIHSWLFVNVTFKLHRTQKNGRKKLIYKQRRRTSYSS